MSDSNARCNSNGALALDIFILFSQKTQEVGPLRATKPKIKA